MEQQWLQTKTAKTILLAEDEHPLRALIVAMLWKAGYNVIIAVDGHEGLAKSREFKGTIHLLFDVELPNVTGIELATQIQIDRPEIRVLLMSGMISGMLLLNEGWQFLPKPFMANLLKESIRHLLLERRPMRNQAAPRANKQISKVKPRGGVQATCATLK